MQIRNQHNPRHTWHRDGDVLTPSAANIRVVTSTGAGVHPDTT
jgi:hypothetical protein